MRQLAGRRLTLLAGKVGENAPAATACCMSCRTCVTSSLLGLTMVPLLAVGAAFRRRFASPS